MTGQAGGRAATTRAQPSAACHSVQAGAEAGLGQRESGSQWAAHRESGWGQGRGRLKPSRTETEKVAEDIAEVELGKACRLGIERKDGDRVEEIWDTVGWRWQWVFGIGMMIAAEYCQVGYRT